MDNKMKFAALVFIVIFLLFALFTLAGARLSAEDDALAFLPVIMNITGTPPPSPTAIPPTSTPTPTATPLPRHFDDCAYKTGSNATVAIPVGVTINGDLELAVDDEIAVFTPDGTLCAGMIPWVGANVAVTAWGDDSQTEEVDGLRDGEEMMFRIWDKSADEEVLVATVTYSLGNGIYVTDGLFAVSSFTLE